jgi:hypothetical protein
MDPVRERVAPEDPLRILFHEAGRISAPVDLEARVLQRLDLPADPLAQSPLIGARGWTAIAILVATFVLLGFRLSPTASTTASLWAHYASEWHWEDMTKLFTAPLLAACTSLACLAFLDRLFIRGHARISPN